MYEQEIALDDRFYCGSGYYSIAKLKETGRIDKESFNKALKCLMMMNKWPRDVPKSLRLMRKLIVNVTTKAQQSNNEDSSHFRRVKLSDYKITRYIVVFFSSPTES